jgi:hypothetical protein
MMHGIPKAKTIMLPLNVKNKTALTNRLIMYRRAGFDIVGINMQDGKIYLRNSNQEGSIKTKGDKEQWKVNAVERYKGEQKPIKLGNIPTFRNQQELNEYYENLSDKEELLTNT